MKEQQRANNKRYCANWRRKNPGKYRRFMREYMRKRRKGEYSPVLTET